MTIAYCRDCLTHHWNGASCFPKWDVWFTDYGDRGDWSPVGAVDASSAVERWAERHDADGDYNIVSGSPCEVFVAPHGDDGTKPRRFEVSGESVPSYSAYEIADESKDE